MYTIIDYLNYYKDTTVKYVKLNSQDFLIFACLSYLPLDSFDEEMNLQEFAKYSVKFKNRLHGGNTGSLAYQLLKVMVKSKRYQDLKIENFVGKKDDFIQFGAVTFVLGKNKIISFKGSDRSFVSWVENARMFYQYPTNTQKIAIDYLKNAIYKDDDNVYVVGHSKGGNLAMVSSMELESSLLRKVKQIYNFDGPGILKEEYELKYKRIKKKLINIIPSNSMVGVLLYNENFSVIKSKNHMMETHYPSSWCLFGEFFIEDSLKVFSNQLHNYTTVTLEKIDKQMLADAMEGVFQELKEENTKDINLETIKEGLEKLKDTDSQVFRYLNTLFTSLITVNKK